MKCRTGVISIIALTLFPIAALAADAAAPTAPAVQSAAWTIEDYLKAGFSGAAGGLLSGFMALIGIWLKNKSDEKNTQNKIEADKEAQEKAHKLQMERIAYEERRALCAKFITAVAPITIVNGTFDITHSNELSSLILLEFDRKYSNYALYILDVILNDDILMEYPEQHFKVGATELDTLRDRILVYCKFFSSFTLITQKMLAGEDLLPPTKWNLDDFEGSVPVDYRPNLS